MSLFGIIGFSFLIAAISFCVGMVCILFNDYVSDKIVLLNAVISVVILISSVFIGIGINTTNERVYVSKYKVQKETIEASINSYVLGDLEKNKLVNKAIDINGEFAERKFRYSLWHHVHYDNHIYDNVDFIQFNKEEK